VLTFIIITIEENEEIKEIKNVTPVMEFVGSEKQISKY
tara:strand:- start:768 stop:881 length:114 start_codon:yes stop_codon:yes gene_type:complete